MIICPKCGQENKEGSKFCASCGEKLDAGFFRRPAGKVTIVAILAAAAVIVIVVMMWHRSRQTDELETPKAVEEEPVLEAEAVEEEEPEDELVQSEAAGSYILPDSDQRYYTENELSGLSEDQLRLARNEIYARHGRIFDAEDLREYFESQSWYQGTVSAADFSDSVLNDYEKANIQLIQSLEGGADTGSESTVRSGSDQICTFIPIDESCSFDLNGDGIAETISIAMTYHISSSGYQYTDEIRLFVNGEMCASIKDASPYDEYCILNIDPSDGTLQVAIPYMLYDDDENGTALYSYDSSGVHELGTIPGGFYDQGSWPSISCPGDGTIESYKALSVFETWFTSATWMLTGGELVELVPAVYEPLDLFDGRGIDLTVLQSISVTEEEPYYGNRVTLPAGTKVHMTGTNNRDWVSMTSAGYEGTLYLQLENHYWVFPAGSEEQVMVTSVFDNMTNFG